MNTKENNYNNKNKQTKDTTPGHIITKFVETSGKEKI